MHPHTTVITPNTGFVNRPYFTYPYGNYDAPDNPVVDFLPDGVTFSTARPPKELVLGIIDGGTVKGYPLPLLAELGTRGAVNDQVGSRPVVIASLAQWNTAVAFDRRVDDQTLTFRISEAPGGFHLEDLETGTRWNATGLAASGPLAGAQLQPLTDAFVAFWFAWSLFYPEIELYRA